MRRTSQTRVFTVTQCGRSGPEWITPDRIHVFASFSFDCASEAAREILRLLGLFKFILQTDSYVTGFIHSAADAPLGLLWTAWSPAAGAWPGEAGQHAFLDYGAPQLREPQHRVGVDVRDGGRCRHVKRIRTGLARMYERPPAHRRPRAPVRGPKPLQ